MPLPNHPCPSLSSKNRLHQDNPSPWHLFQCCSHPLALLSTLLTPPCPCSDPSSSFVGAKGWHNATSLFLFNSSCFAAQDLITLDTVFHFGSYFHDLQVLSRFLAWLGRNTFLVGGLVLSATAESYISAVNTSCLHDPCNLYCSAPKTSSSPLNNYIFTLS